jgi:D-glycero-D-manno-heptose 1,7-bisphosphate phosphatase
MRLVLLDRDGVLNEDRLDYVKSVEELVIFPRALEALALLAQKGFTCVIVTNQSAVGRGIISEATLGRINGYLCDAVKAHGGNIAEIFVCTDTPDKATYRRKPKPGMLIEALEKYAASPAQTPFIGDTLSDMEAALAAGCPRYLVHTGKGRQAAHSLPASLQPVTVCTDVLDAAQRIVTMA